MITKLTDGKEEVALQRNSTKKAKVELKTKLFKALMDAHDDENVFQ
jgi:hypothetical protein